MQRIKPICLSCGERDNETAPGGFCQNDSHDNWFELLDICDPVLLQNALNVTGLTREAFINLFLDPRVTKIKIKQPA